MSLTKGLFLLAGAAVSLNSVALANAPVSKDEVRAIVAEMLADAETRSSLQGSGATAGYDKKFFIGSANGDFRMNFSGYGQFRYTLNFRDSSNEDETGSGDDRYAGGYPTAGDEFNPGFSVRRAALQFDGNVINPDLMYQVRISYDTRLESTSTVEVDSGGDFAGTSTSTSVDSRLQFDDIFFTYRLGNGWYVKWGQFKAPFLKEELNSENYTMSADRGMVNLYFTQDRSQGVALGYKNDNWWLEGMISDGIRTSNTPFGDTFNNTNDIALTGRVEYLFAGTREQLKDYTSKQDENLAAYIGGAIHWQHQNNDPSKTAFNRPIGQPANRSILGFTVDGQVEGSGLSLYVAGVFGYTRARNVQIDADLDGVADGTNSENFGDFGVTVQGAWRFWEDTEFFTRWDGLFLDDDRNLFDRDQFNFITFGFNHYYSGHAMKITLDCVLATNHTVGLTNSPNSAWFGNSNVINLNSSDATGLLGTARGVEAAVRLQAQVMF